MCVCVCVCGVCVYVCAPTLTRVYLCVVILDPAERRYEVVRGGVRVGGREKKGVGGGGGVGGGVSRLCLCEGVVSQGLGVCVVQHLGHTGSDGTARPPHHFPNY